MQSYKRVLDKYLGNLRVEVSPNVKNLFAELKKDFEVNTVYSNDLPLYSIDAMRFMLRGLNKPKNYKRDLSVMPNQNKK